MKFINILNLYIFLIFLFISNIFCITEDILKNTSSKINKKNVNKEIEEVSNILKEYEELNKKFNSLVEKENYKKKTKGYNQKTFKDEYEKIYKDSIIFNKYFMNQRSKMSNFINKPEGEIDKKFINLYHTVVENSLESKDLIEEIELKAGINKEDL